MSYRKLENQLGSGLLFIAPNLILFVFFVLFPAVASAVLSFARWDGFGTPLFIAFQNYKLMMQDENFLIALKNTAYFSSSTVILTLVLSPILAVALNDERKGTYMFRVLYFIPHLTSIVAIAIVWQLLFDPSAGPINGMLMAIGIKNPPKWLSSSTWAMPSTIIVAVWKSLGYYSLIFLAGLKNIPKQLFEAADIDGASKRQQFFRITLPMLSPTTFFIVVIALISAFKVFTQVYVMTQGGPGRSTSVLGYLIFTTAFQRFQFGYASSMAYILFLIIIIITLIQFQIQKRWVTYLE